MTTLPSISYVTSGNALPFYNPNHGTFKLPPLMGEDPSYRRESIPLDMEAFTATMRRSRSRTSSFSSDTTTTQSASCSRTGTSFSSPKSSVQSASSRSPSPAIPPRIPLSTKPAESPGAAEFRRNSIAEARRNSVVAATESRRNSVVARPAPAFRLIPQPMLDPSRRPIRKTDALVVFPSSAGLSQASQKKAKLLVGKDIETYFDIQRRQQSNPPPKAYAYKMVWERQWSHSVEWAFTGKESECPGSRRGSRVDMDLE